MELLKGLYGFGGSGQPSPSRQKAVVSGIDKLYGIEEITEEEKHAEVDYTEDLSQTAMFRG